MGTNTYKGPMSLQPGFLAALGSDKVNTILLTGCGGGFDFVHGALLLPHLKQAGKRVIIVSYSFGSANNISDAEVVFSEKTPQGTCDAKLVTARATGSPNYEPEIGLCAYLDQQWPAEAPHQVYACYARLFSVPMLVRLYRQVIRAHRVDTVITIDGGSDSLMRGDEFGLGDPIEDTVSVTAASLLSPEQDGIHTKLLISVGFGMDRFNNVCDADGLRAIAELSQSGGFRGSVSIEPTSEAFAFYRGAVRFLNERATFRSVRAGRGRRGRVRLHRARLGQVARARGPPLPVAAHGHALRLRHGRGRATLAARAVAARPRAPRRVRRLPRDDAPRAKGRREAPADGGPADTPGCAGPALQRGGHERHCGQCRSRTD